MFSTSKQFIHLKPRLATSLRPRRFVIPKTPFRRLVTTSSPPSPSSRTDRIISKLPKSLHPYAKPLLTHPTSHLTSFLILHEISAIIPLFAFFAVFHITSWNPADLLPTEWVDSGYHRFKRYVERKAWDGWIDARGLLDLAIAWAVVKALMPVRVLGSIWAAPWFARRVILPVVGLVKRR
ncbi:hypothetical protein TWF718_008788 [Orbilia javanica]|uniref:Uncharacterized protein n=1 Tax=Orbilia javanica TaxID=47235 RepID=A0AAN8RM09_9PEZI